ncbi:Retroelement pol Polyprotein [Phytophthora megakarya]|uniref:Retroelement pol Polyprotein n=1 Tax=Phytophthora megakarya TaxID=4795 RepID=A0A225VHH5_9STRA|nr:Retroelement pol Polyprotein [Phytophthora megakarya]
MQDLIAKLTDEFVPPDLQERLRDQLYALKQKNCPNLEEYISRFREAIMQVTEMSELDKITYFTRGLVSPTREEVQYRRCTTVSQAMKIALEYDRSHHIRGKNYHNEPEPMEIDSGSTRNRRQSSSSSVSKRCRYCKKPGHVIEQCYKLKNKEKHARRNQHEQSSANFSVGSTAVTTAPADDEVTVVEVEEISTSTLSPVHRENELIRKQGTCEGQPVVIMFDSGATCNVVRPGLVDNMSASGVSQVTRFDGTSTRARSVKKGIANIGFGRYRFHKLQVMEWPLGSAHDVILGKPWFTKFQPIIDWRSHDISFPSIQSQSSMQPVVTQEAVEIAAADFKRKVKKNSYEEVYRVKICAIPPMSDSVPEPILKVLNEFTDVFPKALPDGLPPSRRVDFELNMKPDAVPSNRGPFRLSKVEQDALDLFVAEKLKKGWIEVSDSPWVSNIFGIPKIDPTSGRQISRSEWVRSGNSTLPIRWVIDYRYVNLQSIVPKIPLPRIDELFDQMNGCVIFSVLDLAQGYHQMRIAFQSRKYTAFRTHAETYQWCVAPMGLAGMPGVWSRLMRVLFAKYTFIVVYLDDICVFSVNMEEHVKHLRILFEVLRRENLYCHMSKCHFGQPEVKFLGHTISAKGLAVDSRKTEAIAHWPAPTNQKQLQSFLGLAGYYRRFIRDYATLALPLGPLVKKEHVWNWDSEQTRSFEEIKSALQEAPVLKLPDHDKRFIVTTDASGYCVGGVLSQVHSGQDHPIAFFSKKLGPHEINWPTHEKELLAIRLALEKWRHYLYGREFDIYTDNTACKWFLHHPKVSPKLARFLTFFAQFTFKLHHVKGQLNVVADALSRPPMEVMSNVSFHHCTTRCQRHVSRHTRNRRSSLVQFRGEDIAANMTENSANGQFIRPNQSVAQTYQQTPRLQTRTIAAVERVVSTNVTQPSQNSSSLGWSESVRKEFTTGYRLCPDYSEHFKHPEEPFVKQNGLLFRKSQTMMCLCVPHTRDNRFRTAIIECFHDSNIAAHPGAHRTYLRIAQWYHWPTLDQDV